MRVFIRYSHHAFGTVARKGLLLLSLLTMAYSAQAADLSFTAPASDSIVKNRISVSVRAPASANASAQKINLKVDDQFYRTQPYGSGRINYTFGMDTRGFSNGKHKLTVLTIDNGRVVSLADRTVNISNEPLVLSTPTPAATLSGSVNATGIVRVPADKLNIKFDDNNDLVYSQPLSGNRRKARPFSITIDTTRLENGPHTLIARAVTNQGRDLKTISIPVNVQNDGRPITWNATVVPIPDSGAYMGAYTFDDSLGGKTFGNRLIAIDNFETLIYGNNSSQVAMDRQFFRWDTLLNDTGELNQYIIETAEAGRIPVISLYTLNHATGQPPTCDRQPGLKIWACIEQGFMDPELVSFARAIGNSGISKLLFSFVHEPENEICFNRLSTAVSPDVCGPANMRFDMGTIDNYTAAWRRLVTVFEEQGVMNTDFIWIMQAASFDEAIRIDRDFDKPIEMYPGGDVIDWLGADAYNTDFSNGRQRSMDELVTPFLRWAAANAPNKPLALPEFGVAEDPSAVDPDLRRQWLLAARDWLKRQPRIKAVMYWNRLETFRPSGRRDDFRDWRIDDVTGTENLVNYDFRREALPRSLNGFQAFVRDPHFLTSTSPVNRR